MGISTSPTSGVTSGRTTSRAFRAAGWIVIAIGVMLLILVGGYAGWAFLIVAGNPGSHEAADTGMLAIVLLPAAIGGVISLWLGRLLRRGGSTGRLAGLAWVAMMGSVCLVAGSGEGNLLSALRVLLSGGTVAVIPGGIVATMPGEAGYFGYFSDPAFWATGILGGATMLVLALVIVGREAPGKPDHRAD